jgi:hypothetical protein
VHSADPQTLAYALHYSPVGLCAWILERPRAWSDCDGDVLRRVTHMPAGGHFAPMDEPELLVDDLRAFRPLRAGAGAQPAGP